MLVTFLGVEMGRKKRVFLDDMQLYEHFKRFEREVDNIDDTYVLIGASVLDALIKCTPTISKKDREQHSFQQMKKVYEGLSQVTDYFKKMGSFNVILIYERDVMQELELLQNDSSRDILPQSLLENILDTTGILDKKNKMTIIRDSGSRLYHNVIERGPYQGNRNIMLKDYSDIEAAFR